MPNASHAKNRVLVVFGTRPEAIKLCPLIQTLRQRSDCRIFVCATGQHREMLDQVLSAFDVVPDFNLNVMQAGQSLAGLTSRLVAALEPIILMTQPALTIVQGDTTTTLCGALSCFYANVPIAHVEAGLRTFDLGAPFPEEMNRVFATRLASLHFAATEGAAANLRQEGVAEEKIEVTGNTGIDAILSVSAALAAGRLKAPVTFAAPPPGVHPIVVTAHRRESFGEGFVHICQAIRDLASRDDVQIIWPVHPNPNVRRVVDETLRGHPRITLAEPLDYLSFVDLMRHAHLLITDSGGVQEEGPSLGKPVLVLRDKTERPEAVEAGTVKLVGANREAIVREAVRLLEDTAEYNRMSRLHNPYGDGHASERIAQRIASFLGMDRALAKAHKAR